METGDKIPASFDATEAWTTHFEERVNQLINDAAEAGLAISVLTTFRRELSASEGSNGFNEQSQSASTSCNVSMHSYAFMVGSAISVQLANRPDIMLSPEAFIAMCVGAAMSTQDVIKKVAKGEAHFTPNVTFNNGEEVDPQKLH